MIWDDVLPRFYDFLLFEKGHSSRKVTALKKHFRLFSATCAYPFTFQDLRNFLMGMKEKELKATYICFFISSMNLFMRWCELERLEQENLADALNKLRPRVNKKPDAAKLLSVEEIRKLLVNPPPSPKRPNQEGHYKQLDDTYSLLFAFIYRTCCRSGEAIELQKKNFNFSNHSVTFLETKNGDTRNVAIPPDMEEQLKKLVESLSDTDYLFTAYNGTGKKSIGQDTVNRAFQQRAHYAGIKRHVTIHMLRHSGITHMQINGAPVAVVQAIAGHRQIATTQLYTHVIVENQRQAMIKYNPLIKNTIDKELLFRKIKEVIEDMGLQEIEGISYSLTQETGGISFSVHSQSPD